MKRAKRIPSNPYQRGVGENCPSLLLSAGQYVSVALGLAFYRRIQPEEGDNVFAMWLRSFAERGTGWEKLSQEEKLHLQSELYWTCYNRAITLGPDTWMKSVSPVMSEAEFDQVIAGLQKSCGWIPP